MTEIIMSWLPKKEKVQDFWKAVKGFFSWLLKIFTDVLRWMLLSYIIPIFNVFLVIDWYQEDLSLISLVNKDVITIFLTTNACYIVSVISVAYKNKKKREMSFWTLVTLKIFNFGSFVAIVVAPHRFPLGIFAFLIVATLLISGILSFFVRADEANEYQEFADQSKGIKKADVGGVKIKM